VVSWLSPLCADPPSPLAHRPRNGFSPAGPLCSSLPFNETLSAVQRVHCPIPSFLPHTGFTLSISPFWPRFFRSLHRFARRSNIDVTPGVMRFAPPPLSIPPPKVLALIGRGNLAVLIPSARRLVLLLLDFRESLLYSSSSYPSLTRL